MKKLKKCGRYKYKYLYDENETMRSVRKEQETISRMNMKEDFILMSTNDAADIACDELRNTNENDVFTNVVADRTGSINGGVDKEGDCRGSRAKMRSEGIIRKSHKVEVRKRRRERMYRNTFRLTDYGARGSRRKLRLDSDSEWFEEGCRIGRVILEFLSENWLEVPHLRCCHLKENNWKLISLCTARRKDIDGNGSVISETITISLMVEMSRRDLCCVNYIEKRARSQNADATSTIIVCSCDIRREDGLLVESTCWHRDKIRGNKEIMKAFREVVGESSKDDDGSSGKNRYFGSWIISEHGSVTVDGEAEGNVICTQLEQTDGLSLTQRGKNIARRWSSWNVYDMHDSNFIYCIRSAIGSGVQVTKMKCCQCKLGPRRKCRHETGCINVLTEAGMVKLTEKGEMQENVYTGDIDGDEQYGTSGSEYSESEEDTLCEVMDETNGMKGENKFVEARNERIQDGKCLYQPKNFFSCNKPRPLYMCPAEERMTEKLTDFIEEWGRRRGGLSFVDPDGWPCVGKVRDAEGNETLCLWCKDSSVRILPRKVTLFTLNHDLLIVVLKDWVCTRCGFENRYNGESHGIYPAAKHRAFTVEIMYFWLHECINGGSSFRTIFELTHNLQNSRSYRRKLDTHRLDVLSPEFRRDRRLANTALRVFVQHLDLADDSLCTKAIFTCRKCEVQIDASDCMQLGLNPEHAKSKGAKRFKCIVMDGKVIGALRDFPIKTDNLQTLVAAKGLPSKIMSNRITRTVLKYFTDGVRRMIRAVEYGRSREVNQNISYRNGKVQFRLGYLLELKGVTKKNYERYLKIARWFCDPGSCVCSGSSWKTCLSHERCVDERAKLMKTSGCVYASRFMTNLFGVSSDGGEGEPVHVTSPRLDMDMSKSLAEVLGEASGGQLSEQVDEHEEHESDVTDSSDSEVEGKGKKCVRKSGVDIKQEWVYFKLSDCFKCTEVLEALLENIQFVLGEPMTLGFFPFRPHKTSMSSAQSGTDKSRVHEEGINVYNWKTNKWLEEVARTSQWDMWSLRYMSVLNLLESPDSFELTAKEILHFKKEVLDMLTMEVEGLYRDVSDVMLKFAACTHDGRSLQVFPCGLYTKKLEEKAAMVGEQNTVLTLLLTEINRVGKRAPLLCRASCRIVHELLDIKVAAVEKLKKEAARNHDRTVWDYWTKYGHFAHRSHDNDDNDEGEDGDSMFVFPGRQLLRPPMKTDGKDKSDCKKKYFTSRPNMTTFVSLQCACRHPKIVGFALIKEVESISTAISTVLAFLRFPPRTLWYDNACNLYNSALLRIPFLLRSCFPVIDRFHYQGHTCSNYYNPDRYKTLVQQRSVAEEVMNAVLHKSVGFIRYLKGENIRPYLKAMFAVHNFKSMLRDELNRGDLPLMHLAKHYNRLFKCTCPLCIVREESDEWVAATKQSVSFEPIRLATPSDNDVEEQSEDVLFNEYVQQPQTRDTQYAHDSEELSDDRVLDAVHTEDEEEPQTSAKPSDDDVRQLNTHDSMHRER